MSEWLKMDTETLLSQLVGGSPTSPQHETAKAVLQVRQMQAQEKSSEALVASTDKLVGATKALGWYTAALVAATAVLVWVTWKHGG